ncbi:MAG: cytidylate kinase-like family protein [Pseudomonadota bacterium]
MPIVAITREMGSLGKDVATGLGEALGLPVIYHEVIDHLADRMRLRRSHVINLLDGKAGLLQRITADQTSLFIHSADEIIAKAMEGRGAIIRGWGATHLLRDVAHVVTVRVCAPLELRRKRMMERIGTGDAAQVAEEIHRNDEAHTAIVRRHYGLNWSDSEHYDLVLNTERVSVPECVEEVLGIVRSPKFAETDASRRQLEDLALSARVWAALRRSPETRDTRASVSAAAGVISVSGCGTEEMLKIVEVAVAVPGVRDVAYRARESGDLRPALH